MSKERTDIPFKQPSFDSDVELARMKLPEINRKMFKGIDLSIEEKIIWEAFGAEYKSKHRFLKSKV